MSSISSPPAKRPRNSPDSSEQETESIIKQSPRFWFDDGNVILQADYTQFRVHRTVLALHSEILKDCFGIPQPAEVQTVEGCPIVHLSDAENDIDNMLALLYGLHQTHPGNVDSVYFSTMLRLGHKYEIPQFKDTTVEWLKALFPSSFSEWKRSYIAYLSNDVGKINRKSPGFLFDVINLALEHDILSVLPAAFLFLYSFHHLDKILQGVIRPDGSLASLTPAAMQTCLLGRSMVTAKFIQHIKYGIEIDDPFITAYLFPLHNCKSSDSCKNGVIHVCGQLIGLAAAGEGPVHIPTEPTYFDISYDLEDRELSHPFCSICFNKFEELFYDSLSVWWRDLPTCLRLPAWNKMPGFLSK